MTREDINIIKDALKFWPDRDDLMDYMTDMIVLSTLSLEAKEEYKTKMDDKLNKKMERKVKERELITGIVQRLDEATTLRLVGDTTEEEK